MLLTPAEHEIAGFCRWQAYENKRSRADTESLVRSVESLTAVNERLTQNAIERDAAMTELMVKSLRAIQAQIATAQASMISGYDAQGSRCERTALVLRYRPRGDEKITDR